MNQIALVSLGQVALESFFAGASLLAGLFLYDVISVFQSDAMVTVATKIEAPVKLLFAGATVSSLFVSVCFSPSSPSSDSHAPRTTTQTKSLK